MSSGDWVTAGLGAADAAIWVLISLLIILLAFGARSGGYSRKIVVLVVLLAGLSLLLFISSFSAIVAAVSLFAAVYFTLSAKSLWRVAGTAFAFAFALILSGAFLSPVLPVAEVSYGYAILFASVGFFGGSLTGPALIIISVALLLHSISRPSKQTAISEIVALIGVVVFASGLLLSSLAPLSSSFFWTFVSDLPGQGVTLALSEVLLLLASFCIIITLFQEIAIRGSDLTAAPGVRLTSKPE